MKLEGSFNPGMGRKKNDINFTQDLPLNEGISIDELSGNDLCSSKIHGCPSGDELFKYIFRKKSADFIWGFEMPVMLPKHVKPD